MIVEPEELSPSRSFSHGRSSGGGLRFCNLRGVRWRINLGILPSSQSASIEDLRRIAADSRRSYASLRRQLLIDPHTLKDGNISPDLAMDNPLSQNPESTWGRFFHHAEIEKMVSQDLSRLYPEDGNFFQTSACQGMLRRILLLWCLRHPEYGYGQGMHELLAPLVYVLHTDADYLSKIRGLYVDYFKDEFDELTFPENDLYSRKTIKKAKSLDFSGNDEKDRVTKITCLDDLDSETRDIFLLSDSYGAEGELGVVISERFMEHDSYSMFDALMSGAHGVVSMADFFSVFPSIGFSTGIPPIIEASSAVYHLLAVVDSYLYRHLVELGVEPQYFALRWLRVLFEREFSLDDLLVVWDELFSSSNASNIENDEYHFRILCSARGAFMSAMAVSMLLHVRSSLLTTENATSCLQKLLNFPRSINMVKLIENACSYQALALEANILSSSQPSSAKNRPLAQIKADSVSPKTTIVADSYWEEKWRVLQKEEALLSADLSKGRKIKDMLGNKLGLSRTESVPLPSKNLSGKKPAVFYVRRSLFNVYPQCQESPPLNADARKDLCDDNISRTPEFLDVKLCSDAETSSVSSMASSVATEINGTEIESEKNSPTLNLSIDENEEGEQDSYLETLTPSTESETTENTEVAITPEPKERKTLAGRFQWFWKFRKTSSSEQSLEKEAYAEKQRSSSFVNGNMCQEPSPSNNTCCGDSVRIEAGDIKMMSTFKSLGQSMLENIQAIESVFQQERGSAGSVHSGKGQTKVFAALKELRKVSNLLSEM